MIHFAAIRFHPIAIAQRGFTRNRHHSNIAAAGAVGVRADFDQRLLATGGFEEAVKIIGGLEVAPVHGQQILAGHDVHARFGERRAQRRIPILAEVHALETIAAVGHFVIGAQQAAGHAANLREVAAAHVVVTNGKIRKHLRENGVQVVAAGHLPKILFVFRFCRRQIHAVQARVIEEVALDAPDFIEHLPPFGAGFHIHFHRCQIERAIAGARRLRGAHNGPRLPAPEEHL